jgi:hypothetical protein
LWIRIRIEEKCWIWIDSIRIHNPGFREKYLDPHNQVMRMQIAKQYSPWGFHYTLEAATAQWVRKEEDRCTYLNKGQFYGVTLEYRPSPTENLLANLTEVKSVVVLVFRWVVIVGNSVPGSLDK